MPHPDQEGQVNKVSSGISGFDVLSRGGLPKGRATLVAGSPGSAKTIFSTQFLVAGMAAGEPAVFVTFEESPEDIRRNVLPMGWDIARWEAEGKWLFVDGREHPADQGVVGACSLEPVTIRIRHAIERIGGQRLVIDSLAALLLRFPDQDSVRSEIGRVLNALKEMNVTAIITAERVDEYGPISRDEVEGFVCDNVVVLRHVLERETRHRSIEILKYRGTTHGCGEVPFTINSADGIAVVAPLLDLASPPADARRLSSGIAVLDQMCGGGLTGGLVTLLSGPSGSGKTIFAGSFAAGSPEDRCLYVSTEEGTGTLARDFAGCGIAFDEACAQGRLKVLAISPNSAGMVDHLTRILRELDAFQPQRLVIDSLASFERITPALQFNTFVSQLTDYARARGIVTILTTTARLVGHDSLTEDQALSVADAIILLRYIEVFGEVRRGITVLKLRGSQHDHGIREFTITNDGINIGHAFRNVSGILAGTPSHGGTQEESRVESMFERS
ncbi:MAG: Circadian clock protein kinase KaiC [Pseudomonadota bacterium]